MTLHIEYIAIEKINIPEDTPKEIIQIIVENAIEDASVFLEYNGFEAQLKKIKQKP